MSTAAAYFVGVDVGTGGVRAGLFDQSGQLISISSKNISIWNPQQDYFEQSSDQIWDACCSVVKDVIKDVDVEAVEGIGFDATCSLVVLGPEYEPITVSPTGQANQNIIMWMDHRAREETESVNAVDHSAFRFVGGKVSIEMQLPKLLWLKRNLSETWNKSQLFFDLPDFLTWKATGSQTRSQCSLVCKWNYLVDEKGHGGWSRDLLQRVGLEDLLDNESQRIGKDVDVAGKAVGQGLTASAARQLGLKPATPVSVSLIDAYAGALGLLATKTTESCPLHQKLAVICGTSSCHMLAAPERLFVPGVWGPYADVLLAGHWLLEGGQSATGKLLDHVVETHPAYAGLRRRLASNDTAAATQQCVADELIRILERTAALRCTTVTQLTADVHVWPDFHGNRSPLADPRLKGMVCGLTLDTSEENLALLYLATNQALAYGTRHIMDSLRHRGAPIGCLLLCGGLAKSRLFITTVADATETPVVVPRQPESVLLGSAMLAACASRRFASLHDAVDAMGGAGLDVQPTSNGPDKRFHQAKYRVFLKMLKDQKEYERIMSSA